MELRRYNRVDNAEEFDIILPPTKKVVSIKLDVDIIEELDKIWRQLGYRSRSEFIREAILFYMQYVQSIKGEKKTSEEKREDRIVKELEEVIEDIVI